MIFFSTFGSIAVFVFCCVLAFQRWWRKPHPKFPPGPRGIPIFGMLPFLGKFPAETIKQMSYKKYGPLMSIRLGMEDYVILNNWEVMNQAFVKQGAQFAGRPYIPLFNDATGDRGLVFKDYNEDFKVQKHFGLKTLRDRGLGKKAMEEIVNQESLCFVEFIKGKLGEKVDAKKYFFNLTGNVISKVAWGERYEYDDEKFDKLLEDLKLQFGDPVDAFRVFFIYYAPFLRYVPYFRPAYQRFVQRQMGSITEMEMHIENHKRRFSPNDIRDFMDAYLYEQKYGTLNNKESFTEKQLVMFCKDLFLAGTETSSSTLAWAYLLLFHHPQFVKPLEDEIQSALGSDGIPTLASREQMPLVCAFIQECMRFKTLATIAASHRTTEDVKINGYVIPKDTTVLPSLWGVHMDPDLWSYPDKFNPYRHIDKNGKFVPSNKIVPFSMGLRFCLGETLARLEIFVFFTKILQTFRVKPASYPLSTLDGVLTTLYVPEDLEIVFEER